MQATLLVLAAGMGSRYGGLKQMDRLGPAGESIIDYSVFDAVKAGFSKAVFVLREEIVDDFYTLFANKYKKKIKVEHSIQRLSDIPEGFKLNPDRIKPWGTAHAVLSARSILSEPFAVINGDDYYGPQAYEVMYKFLSEADHSSLSIQSMVGYILKNTLSEFGFVSRGICSTNSKNYLTSVTEIINIEKKDGQIIYLDDNRKEHILGGDETVSMNFWGFTPAVLAPLSEIFEKFMFEKGGELKSEFYIPYAINILINNGLLNVEVLESAAKWFGVTYKEDKPNVIEKLTQLSKAGVYPDRLWPD